jgi:predicted neuraminidase
MMELVRMRIFKSIFFFILLFAQITLSQEKDKIDIPVQPGYLKSEFIYPLNNKPTAQCHASTIAETANGLVAAWFGGTEEKNPDVGIWFSRLENGEWTKPAEAANGIHNDGKRYPCWNPVLFQPKKGPLMLFYKVGPDPQKWWGMLTTSTDCGITWTSPITLPDSIVGPIKNKPVQLANGTILCPSSSENEGWRVHFELTDDLGKTWKKTAPINDGKENSAIQPSILIHSNSVLQILCRSREGVILQSWSKNNGKTWSRLSATELPNPNSGTDAVTLKDKRHILVYNHSGMIEGRWGGDRTPLNVAISNNGISWRQVLILENEPGEYSYPAVIQSADGLVHITYTYRRETIKHVVIDPAKIKI